MKWRFEAPRRIGRSIFSKKESFTSSVTWMTQHWSRRTVGRNESLTWWLHVWNSGKLFVANSGNNPCWQWPGANPRTCSSIALEASIEALGLYVLGSSWVTTTLQRMPSSCCLRKDLPCARGTIAPMSWRLCGSWKVCVPSGTWNWVRRTEINLHHCSSGETVRGEPAKSVANCCLSVQLKSVDLHVCVWSNSMTDDLILVRVNNYMHDRAIWNFRGGSCASLVPAWVFDGCFWSWSKSNYWNVSSAVLCTKVGTSEPRRFTTISKHHFVLVCVVKASACKSACV